MRSAAAGSGLQAERRAFGCGTEGGGRHGRGPRLSAAGLEGRRRGGVPVSCRPLAPGAGLWGRLDSLSVGCVVGFGGPCGEGGRGLDKWVCAVVAAARPVAPRCQRLQASCTDAGRRGHPDPASRLLCCFFFFFLRKRQLLPKERSHICLRTVIGLSCNLIREGAVAPPRPLFPFFFVSGSVRGFLAF